VIQLEDVSKEFVVPGREPVVAVQGVDLRIGQGETVCMIGTSGCGKTTMLRLINRLEEPSSGRIVIDGDDTMSVDPVRLRRRIGYVIQSGGLFPHMTVAENVGLLGRLEGWSTDRIRERVAELLEIVHLPPDEFAQRYPSELSGGQRQRIGIARALMLDPPILLMDEPFGALDPITRGEIQEEFADLERLVAKTVVIVTHDLEEAFRLGDRIALMSEGRLVQVGTPDELRREPATDWVRRFVTRNADEG